MGIDRASKTCLFNESTVDLASVDLRDSVTAPVTDEVVIDCSPDTSFNKLGKTRSVTVVPLPKKKFSLITAQALPQSGSVPWTGKSSCRMFSVEKLDFVLC
jgi:hypothetical protein